MEKLKELLNNMQCKNLDTNHILTVLSKYQGQWAFWTDEGDVLWFKDSQGQRIVIKLFPNLNIPKNLMQAKWKNLMSRDLIGGCACGCRGDFEITDKGLALISQPRTKPYTGY